MSNIKEYLYYINKEVYKVYAIDNESATKTLKDLCEKYSKTNRGDYKKYWLNILELINKDKYYVIENSDFDGVRKMI